MAFENNSPNMNLPIPGVGLTSGPQYATDINNSLTIVDGHNHTSGSGVQIPPAGLNINSDLTFQQHNATNLRSSRYFSQATTLTGVSDLSAVYAVTDTMTGNSNLWYTNGLGTPVQITNGNSIAAAGGSIGGLPDLAASVTFSDPTYTFLNTAGAPAELDAGDIFLRNSASPTFATELSSHVLTGNTHQTLPLTPAGTAFMTMDASGGMQTSVSTTNGITGAMIAINTVSGGAGGNIVLGSITGAAVGSGDLAGNTITSANISPGTIVGTSIATSTITGTNIASNTVTPGNLTVQSTASGAVSASAFSVTPVLIATISNPATNNGRNQIIMLSNSGTSAAYLNVNGSILPGVPDVTLVLKQVISGVPTTYATVTYAGGASQSGDVVRIPLSIVNVFAANPGIGFSSWQLYGNTSINNLQASFVNAQLVAYEM